ncbi:MAG: hypothetical protein KIT69_06440 [Propionibacteriaceae bacterium]|nr:hypothetical protein [Propionibacteriaceae bacterium]
MSQPPQGQNPYQRPYGQPQQPAPGWNQAPYPGAPGQAPHPGAPGQAPYPGAPAPYPQPGVPYGAPQYYQVPVPAKPKRGKGLGIAGFLMVLIGAGVGVWGSWMFGSAAGEMFVRLGIPLAQLENFDPTSLPDSELAAISIVMMPALVASLVGIVGWILCIVATVRGSARPLAIIGIVLGVLAPIAEYFAMAAGLAAGMGLLIS